MKLTPKLISSFLLLGLAPLFIFATLSINSADQGLKHLATQQLESIRDSKKASIQRYFEWMAIKPPVLSENWGYKRQ